MKAYIQIQNLKKKRTPANKVFNGANLTVDISESGRARFIHEGNSSWFEPSEFIVLGKEHDVKKPLSRF